MNEFARRLLKEFQKEIDNRALKSTNENSELFCFLRIKRLIEKTEREMVRKK